MDMKNNEMKQLSSIKSSDATQRENYELQQTVKLTQSELEMALSTHDSQKQILLTLNQQFATRIQDLVTIHDEITTALQT